MTPPAYGLGTAALSFGGSPEHVDGACRTIREAIRVGFDLIDTSPLYANGTAEEGVGRALEGVPRSSYRLSTKTGYVLTDEAIAAMQTPDPRRKRYPDRNYSADFTRRSVDRSLQRLGTDHLDVLFLHDVPAVALPQVVREAAPLLQRMREQGTVGRIGIGMTTLPACLAATDALDPDLVMIAGQYTLLVQDAAEQLLGRCQDRGITVLLAGPLNSGLLADPYADMPRFNYGPATQPWIEKARQVDAVCRRHEVPLRAAALQFPLAHPAIECVITGPASVQELEDNLRMARHPVPVAVWEDLKAERLLPVDVPTPA